MLLLLLLQLPWCQRRTRGPLPHIEMLVSRGHRVGDSMAPAAGKLSHPHRGDITGCEQRRDYLLCVPEFGSQAWLPFRRARIRPAVLLVLLM